VAFGLLLAAVFATGALIGYHSVDRKISIAMYLPVDEAPEGL
jgi:hypothetical protein